MQARVAAARTRLAIASSHFRPPAGNAGAYKGSLSTLQVDGAYTSEAPPFLLQLEGTRYEMGCVQVLAGARGAGARCRSRCGAPRFRLQLRCPNPRVLK